MLRIPAQRRARRGAVAVEGAIISSVFLLLMLVMIDIGVAVFRQYVISQAARHGARQAIVHGLNAPSTGGFGGPWGTGTLTVMAHENEPRANAIRPMCQTCKLDETQIVVEWPQNSNDVGRPVRVTVTTPYRPILLSLIGTGWTLRASSTMLIAH